MKRKIGAGIRNVRRQRWLPIAGAIILFLSWLSERTVYERWSSNERSLERAESIYLTFLASSFAMDAIPKADAKYNEMNFSVGLSYMARALPEDLGKDWEERIAASENLNQTGLDLMAAVENRKAAIERNEAVWWWFFMSLYGLGSGLVLLSDLFKIQARETDA